MLLDDVATKLHTSPGQLIRESLSIYLRHRLRSVESELFSLAKRYGVTTVSEMDDAVREGRFSEETAFEDYFRFDYLEDERNKLKELIGQV